MPRRRHPWSKSTVGRTRKMKVGMRGHTKNGGRDRLHKEMTVRMKDVVAVTEHVAFSDESWSESDSPMTAKVECCPIVRVYVPAVDRRGLQKYYIPLRDESSQMCHYSILKL